MPSSVAFANTQAVSSLLKGEYHESVSLSRQALYHVQALISRNEIQQQKASDDCMHDEDLDNVEDEQDSPSQAAGIESVPIDVDPSASSRSSTVTPDQSTGIFSFFNRALLYNDAECSSEQDERDCHTVDHRLVAVVLYNAGLCHHIVGLQQRKSTELQLGLNFYKMALSLIAHSKAEQGTTDDDHVLLVLALLNNMYHIESHFVSLQRTRKGLQTVRSWFVATGEGEGLSTEDFLFFHAASFLTTPEQLMSAPTA